MRIHYLIHLPEEMPGAISDWAAKNNFSEEYTRLWENKPFPDHDSYDLLVIMGGSMNIYEYQQYPWLKAEKEFIKSSIQAGKKVFGICLGSQLIADALGGKIFKNNYSEIGFFPVYKTKAGEESIIGSTIENGQMVLHWHGDTFSIPSGAVHLFYSDACKNQAFIYKNMVLALQFHLEITIDMIKDISEIALIGDGPYEQSLEEMVKQSHLLERLHENLYTLLDAFITYRITGGKQGFVQ